MTVRSITLGDVARYTLLPAFIPRLRTLLGSGFGSFSFFVALVYRAVRLLPDGHPYLNPANLGRFGLIAVMTEAWRYVRFNRQVLKQNNIDQIIVFGVIIAAVFLLIFQFITLALALFLPSAMAFSFPGGASFATPFDMFAEPSLVGTTLAGKQSFYDLSFMFLDRVFGVPGMFGSCIADGVADSCKPMGSMYGAGPTDLAVNDPGVFPWPYHHALHGIFQFYSIGLLVVAIFLLIYFTIVVVAETAQTGTPFGKRFNTLWAPLRLVFAAGLLIPISFGLNAGQYIVLYAAKYGAHFASNGWIGFNQVLISQNSTALGGKELLIGKPGIPDAGELVRFATVMHACKSIEDQYLQPKTALAKIGGKIDAYVKPDPIEAWVVRPRGKAPGDALAKKMADFNTYDEVIDWANFSDVIIRFGIEDKGIYQDKLGSVLPVCGEIVFPTTVFPGLKGDPLPAGVSAPAYANEGATMIARSYWEILQFLIFKRANGEAYPKISTNPTTLPWNVNEKIAQVYFRNHFDNNNAEPLPDAALRKDMVDYINGGIRTILTEAQAREAANTSDPMAINNDLLVRGWAGAGIWYNRIAEINGGFTTAAWNLPRVSKYPDTMESVAAQKAASQVNVSPQEIFSPYVQNQAFPLIFARGEQERAAANAYWGITQWWQTTGGFTTSTRAANSGNVILDIINFLFGTSGLFSIRENANVHPLAQLSTIGKSLVERSVTLLGVGVAGTAAQPWVPRELAGIRSALGVVSGFAFSILAIGASAGFVLYYIIPFLPFIYFFFAVAGWVKAIFEAMVGVPLWALAHIRIDGNGLPGDAAMNGYYLVLEIMLRPILIVFGLIASVTIYAASVQVLNDIFNIAVANVTGIDMDGAKAIAGFTMENLRGSIDTFFYTIVYVILVYMLGMSSFKLIDLIPGSLLRWMGSSASPFQDSGDGAANQLVGYGTIGGNIVFGQLAGASKQVAQGSSDILKAVTEAGRR